MAGIEEISWVLFKLFVFQFRVIKYATVFLFTAKLSFSSAVLSYPYFHTDFEPVVLQAPGHGEHLTNSYSIDLTFVKNKDKTIENKDKTITDNTKQRQGNKKQRQDNTKQRQGNSKQRQGN